MITKRGIVLTFELESAEGGSVAGIDEAGRGAWAGPVYAAATVFRPFGTPAAVTELINDSKKLSASTRISKANLKSL